MQFRPFEALTVNTLSIQYSLSKKVKIMKMVKYECSLCHFTKTFQSKRAWKNHLIMEHTAEREGKLMWRCSFCHNLFRGYPRERNFYVHQYQRCFFAPQVKLDLQTGKIEDLLDIPGLGITKINRLIDLRNDRILTLEIPLRREVWAVLEYLSEHLKIGTNRDGQKHFILMKDLFMNDGENVQRIATT